MEIFQFHTIDPNTKNSKRYFKINSLFILIKLLTLLTFKFGKISIFGHLAANVVVAEDIVALKSQAMNRFT
jgi:hypothetical protein